MAKEISLKATVRELDKVTKELDEVRKTATGDLKRQLDAHIEVLEKVHRELTDECHSFFVVPPPPGSSSKKKS